MTVNVKPSADPIPAPLVSKKRGRPAQTAKNLSATQIITVAKALLRQQGKIPSIRALAQALEIDAMAIYHYFNNKQALLEALTCSLVDEIYLPDANDNWQFELTQLSQSYVAMLARYPGLLEILLGMTTHGPAEIFVERFHTATHALKCSEAELEPLLHLLVDYLHGYALAIQCSNHSAPTIDGMTAPLQLLFKALSTERK
uniref:TetR/AcrR family transcriptional regulator n=1 Tax=Thaumasiovibrio occultus TaxID=1891184 RepID=UPI000B354FF9|nr:TetR/AcrR family transcriptional regulator [Thaumasiovibrio occultus]